MKVIVKEGKIVRMSKGIPWREEFSGTYLGITAFSSAIHGRFFHRVETLIRSGRVNDFFNTAVQQLADEGVHVSPSPTWGLAVGGNRRSRRSPVRTRARLPEAAQPASRSLTCKGL